MTAARTDGALPNAITTSLKAISSRLPGRAVLGRSIASGVRISTRARACFERVGAVADQAIGEMAFARGAVLGALLFAVHEHLVLDALGAPGAAGLVAARLLLPRLLNRALGIAQRVRGTIEVGFGAGARGIALLRQRPDHAPPNTVTPTGVSSTMRSTRSSSARSWLATRMPPCQRSSNCATACRPSASRLLVGSSSSSTSGASISRRASATRVRSPPLREAIGRSSGKAGRPVSTSAACSLVSSVQSASAASSSEPSPRFEPAQTGEIVGDAERLRDRQAFIGQLREHADRADALHRSAGGSISPAIRRSSVDLPQPLRPTTPVRSRPSASVSPSNSGRPSGVAREMESRMRKAGMESFRNGQMSRRGELCDVHFSLHGSLGDGFRRFQPGVLLKAEASKRLSGIAFDSSRRGPTKFSSGMFRVRRGLSLRLDRGFSTQENRRFA